MKRGTLEANPFQALEGSDQFNEARKRYIDRETILKVMDATNDIEWKLVIALARFAGLRTPSEPVLLKWEHINWADRTMLVHSPKTEHHAGQGSRVVPIFPEVEKLLADAFEQAEPGAVWVFPRFRLKSRNTGTQLTRLIKRAGVAPWPKLMVNLRASFENDLAAKVPAHISNAILGHFGRAAAKHYLMVKPGDLQAALNAAPTTGAKVDSPPSVEPAQSKLGMHMGMELMPLGTIGGTKKGNRPPLRMAKTPVFLRIPGETKNETMGITGLEPVTSTV